MLKKIGIFILIIVIAGVGIGAYLWNKPAPKAENEQGLKVDAKTLFDAYAKDNKQADSLYLGKWLDVSGMVESVDTNQDGQKILILETGDPLSAVLCVLRDKNQTGEKGKAVTLRGKCTGLVNDVVVNDCIFVK